MPKPISRRELIRRDALTRMDRAEAGKKKRLYVGSFLDFWLLIKVPNSPASAPMQQR